MKKIMSKVVFELEDCEKVIKIFQKAPRNKVSFNLLRQYSNEEMLYNFREAFAKYTYDAIEAKAPTNKQFVDELRTIQSSAKRLKSRIRNTKTHHLCSSLVFSELGGISLEHIDDEDFYPTFDRTCQHLENLLLELTWLEIASEPLLNGELSYNRLRNQDDTREPETKLIISLSDILTKHFFTIGGYSKSITVEEGASGWRVKAIKHLLNKVGIKKKNKQIYDAIA